jgi:hypothetical protein
MEADPYLDEKLDKELPAIHLKCIRAYLEYAQKYSEQDIWNVVPKYFKIIQTQVAMVTNANADKERAIGMIQMEGGKKTFEWIRVA